MKLIHVTAGSTLTVDLPLRIEGYVSDLDIPMTARVEVPTTMTIDEERLQTRAQQAVLKVMREELGIDEPSPNPHEALLWVAMKEALQTDDVGEMYSRVLRLLNAVAKGPRSRSPTLTALREFQNRWNIKKGEMGRDLTEIIGRLEIEVVMRGER